MFTGVLDATLDKLFKVTDTFIGTMGSTTMPKFMHKFQFKVYNNTEILKDFNTELQEETTIAISHQ